MLISRRDWCCEPCSVVIGVAAVIPARAERAADLRLEANRPRRRAGDLSRGRSPPMRKLLDRRPRDVEYRRDSSRGNLEAPAEPPRGRRIADFRPGDSLYGFPGPPSPYVDRGNCPGLMLGASTTRPKKDFPPGRSGLPPASRPFQPPLP